MSPSSTSKSTPKTTTAAIPTTAASIVPLTQATKSPTDSFVCPQSSGLFPVPGDCKQFWHCSNGMSYLKACPGQLVFNDVIGICDYVSRLCPNRRRRQTIESSN